MQTALIAETKETIGFAWPYIKNSIWDFRLMLLDYIFFSFGFAEWWEYTRKRNIFMYFDKKSGYEKKNYM